MYYFTSTYQTFAKNLYVFYSYRASEETRMVPSFHSVVAITSALHAEGPQFDPGWKQQVANLKIRYFFKSPHPLLIDSDATVANDV